MNTRPNMLSLQKTVIVILVAMITTLSVRAEWRADYDALLKKYVSSKGVKYKTWKSNAGDVKKIHVITDAIAKEKPSGGRDAELAFYINAYNAWIIRAVLDNYPTKSIMDVKKDFFKTYSIKVSGKKMSFDKLEGKYIREKFNDARIHFAVNCASTSCPPLHNRILAADTLDTTLNQLTIDFVNSPIGVGGSSGKPAISKIFEWYKADFGNVTSYINKYRRKKISGSIVYQDYLWTLNEAQ